MQTSPTSFDPQFHTRIVRQGARSVWLAAPFPVTVLPQKAALYRAWRADECRRLKAQGDVVLNQSPMPLPSIALALPETHTADCA